MIAIAEPTENRLAQYDRLLREHGVGTRRPLAYYRRQAWDEMFCMKARTLELQATTREERKDLVRAMLVGCFLVINTFAWPHAQQPFVRSLVTVGFGASAVFYLQYVYRVFRRARRL